MKDLARNGTYLVFRQLSQDVRGFWQFVERASRNQDGSSNREAYQKLAAKMVGRWPSGAPLLKAPDQDDLTLSEFNDFVYQETDPQGLNCPVGSHIRRANPRDQVNVESPIEKRISINKRHRLLRRGRKYGQPVDPATLFEASDPHQGEEDRGLYFICVTANISRQFEFVQHTWLNNPNFNGLYNDPDPLLGVSGNFTVPGLPIRKRVCDLPQFITVRGGAYFFMPGIEALNYLANLKP